MDKNVLSQGFQILSKGAGFLIRRHNEIKIAQEREDIYNTLNVRTVLQEVNNSTSPASSMVVLETPNEPSNIQPQKTFFVPEKVTNDETMAYQLDHIIRPLRQLELHLAEGCEIMGKPCDCCVKSSDDIINFSEETIPIAARSGENPELYVNLATWAKNIKNNTAPGKRIDKAAMRLESGNASMERKKLQGIRDNYKIEEK